MFNHYFGREKEKFDEELNEKNKKPFIKMKGYHLRNQAASFRKIFSPSGFF